MAANRTVIDKPNGCQIVIRNLNGRGYRVMVADNPGKRCYVAEPDAWMDDYATAVKWAHIVYGEMRAGTR